MFPTINKRFLLKILLVTLLVGGSVFALHAVQAGRIPDALRRQADLAAEAGKRDAAIGYLRQYLEFRPTDADVQEQLAGLLKERIGNGPPNELLFLYEKILRADPARHAVRREALAVALRLRRFTDAAAHADELVKQFPTEPELWRSFALAHAGQGKADEAVRGYEKAIELAPTDALAYQQLALFQWKELKQVPAARATLDRLVVAAPHDPQPYLIRARFDGRDRPSGGDPADIHKALELDPENLDALVQLADHLQRNRDALGAHDCLTAALRLYPGDTHAVRSLAWLELNRGNLGAAVSVLEGGLERSADGFDLMVPLADLLVRMGNTDRPREIVAKLDAVRGSPAAERVARMQSKYLTGRLAMRDRQWAAAFKTLSELRTMAVDLPGLENQADMLMAVCQQRLGDPAREEQLLLGILNRDPNHLAARGALAEAYLNAGRVEEAMPEYETVTRNQYATAESHIALLKLRANRLRTSAVATPAQWNELERTLPPITDKLGPASTAAVRLRSDLAAWRGDRRRAVAVLQPEAARRPRDAALWAALAVATADYGGVAAGLAVLDEAQAMAGDGADLRLCRATLYARDPALLRPLAPLAAHIDTWPDAEQLRLLYGLIEVYDRIGDDTGVLAMYQRLTARRPAELPLWEGYYERAVKAQDDAAVAAARAAITRLEPTPGQAAALCAAWDAIAARSASAAPAALAGLVAQFGSSPERAEACVALARLKALTGDTTSPLPLLERAVQLEPHRSFAPTQQMIEYLAETGDRVRLQAFLTRLDRDHRWFGEPLQRVVRQSLKRLPPKAGKELLELAARHVEWLPGGTGWVGDGYRLCGGKAEALACYERAATARAATADDWLRLAVRTGELDSPAAAAKVMARAKEAMGKERTPLYLTTAAAFRESGKGPADWAPTLAAPTDRRPYAQARLALKLSQFDRTAAVEVLEAFLTDEELTPGESAWARQNLAMLLVARGHPTDRARAKELLAGADAAGGTPDEKRATVAVLAGLSRHLGGTDRTAVFQRAVTLMEAVAAESKSDRDRFLLAQMHRTAGDRKAGRTILIDLLKAAPTNLDYLISALDEATEPADVEFADRCATVLRRTYPDEFRAVAAVARHDSRVGRADRALALISTYARAADAGPNDLQLRAARSGELLDELARLPNVRKTDVGRKMTDAAVKLYEAVYPTRPEAVVAVAGLLASDGRPDQAFAEIERHARSLPPRVKQMAGLAVIRRGGGTPDQVAAVKGWLAKAKAEEPGSVAVLLDEGQLCVLTNDPAGGQAAFEAAVEKDPTSVVALNNLAWTLAADPDAAARVTDLLDRASREVGLTADLLDTRARMRIAVGQYDAAESDLKHALALGKTPLRLFHMALLNDLRTPRKPQAVADWLAKAVVMGLDERMLHPADLPKFKAMKE